MILTSMNHIEFDIIIKSIQILSQASRISFKAGSKIDNKDMYQRYIPQLKEKMINPYQLYMSKAKSSILLRYASQAFENIF